MYNRYIPGDTSYTRVKEEPPAPPEPKQPESKQPERREHSPSAGGQSQRPMQPRPSQGRPQSGPQDPFGLGGLKPPNLFGGKDGLAALFSGKERNGLSGLLKTLRLDGIDTGDVLLLLIVLYLLVEGDDLELVIALGLVLIMGLGDKEEETT